MQILVLGMHRSGTSLVSRLLNMMGIYFAPEGASTGANAENPKGFWERRDVRNLNDLLLQSLGCDWDRVGSLDLGQIPEQTLQHFRREASKILLAMDASRPWFLKEPRFCVLAPLWLALLEIPICLHVHRSPLEVARSLQTRNGFPLSFGLALWEKYVADSLNATVGKPSLHLQHADFLAHPVQAARKLQDDLQALGVRGLREPSELEITAFIDPRLHRARGARAEDQQLLSPAQKKLHDGLQESGTASLALPWTLSENSREILRRRDREEAAVQELATAEAARQEAAERARRAEEQLAALENRIAPLQGEITALREKIAGQANAIGEGTEQMELLRMREENRQATAREEAEALRREYAEYRRIVEQAAQAEEERTQREVAAMQQQLEEKEAARAGLAGELQAEKKTRSELENLSSHLRTQHEAATRSEAELQGRLETLEHEMAQEVERKTTEAASLQTALQQQGEVLQAAEASVAAAQSTIQAQENRHLQLTRELDNKESDLQSLRQVRAENLAYRKKSEEQIRTASKRIVSLDQSVRRRDDALADQKKRLAETKSTVAKMRHEIDRLGRHFATLQHSRSFQVVLHFARALGLISRKPRQAIKGMEQQFKRLRKLPGKKSAKASLATAGAEIAASSDAGAAEQKKIGAAHELRLLSHQQYGFPIPPSQLDPTARVCLIVLHRSGEQHLRNLFDSFLASNSQPQVEFSLVLHDCTDRSREVIASYQPRLAITISDLAENHSFSFSNNRAAEKTGADYLVFLNNDIIFTEDILPPLLACLQKPGVGLAGLRLNYPAEHAEYPGGIQHLGTKLRASTDHFFHRPINLGAQLHLTENPAQPEVFPAVTAALAICRRADFLQIGGFHEGYLYGYEDVDLCLTLRRLLGLRAISANHLASIHNESATGRLDTTDAVRQRRLNNIGHLAGRHGWWTRRKFLPDHLAGRLFYSETPLTIAFAVTEADDQTAAGDYFTARELGEATAQEFGWKIKYLARNRDWYDLKDVDVVIAMVDAYDLAKISGAKAGLLKVAWMRNWFERWAERPCFDYYDVFLCSSLHAARWLREKKGRLGWTLPLATNGARFQQAAAVRSLASDYCFTGSYWNQEREIASALQPEKLPKFKFAVFGQGWEKHPQLAPYARGFLPYAKMPEIYASTRLVVDDANHVTKDWASVNSRVFDALAAGALVITNGAAGADEVFEGELPHYETPEELHSLLERYLKNEPERRALAQRLQAKVLAAHTYRHRARSLKRILLSTARQCYRIAFKIGSPNRAQMHHWGDYHFARSLGRAMAAEGHSFTIDCLDEWDQPASFGADVVIVLRGLSRYTPKPGQINLMWNISHPDKVTEEEYELYDHVFVASDVFAEKLRPRLKTGVSSLLQCTDPAVFYPEANEAIPAEKILFVGNSRKQYREIVRYAVEADLPLAVYGTHWPMFIPERFVRGEHIENAVLRQHYSRCEILLNDHWPSMRANGFLSNRLFDAAAAGAFVISDRAEGQEAVFGEDLVTYRAEAEFRELTSHYLAHPAEREKRAQLLRERVLAGHTFQHRAQTILETVRTLDRQKTGATALRAASPPLRMVRPQTCVFCLTEWSINQPREWHEQIAVAINSLLANTQLKPVLFWGGDINHPFVRTLAQWVPDIRPSQGMFDELARSIGPDQAGWNPEVLRASILKAEAALAIDEPFFLVADVDTLWLQDPPPTSFNGPLAAGPGGDPGNYSYFNSGVMLIDREQWQRRAADLQATMWREMPSRPVSYDQLGLNRAFPDWSRLPADWEIRPWWPLPRNKPAVVHFHGPKMYQIRALGRRTEWPEPRSHTVQLFLENRPQLEHWLKIAETYANHPHPIMRELAPHCRQLKQPRG